MTPLQARVLEAYGGADRWRRAARVEAVVSAWGLLLRMKRQRPVAEMPCSVEVHRPGARMTPREWQGTSGTLDGGDVRLESPTGEIVGRRDDARRAFRGLGGLRRALSWDRLDLTYFAGYALWNYLAFPALLLRDDVTWSEIAPDVLEAAFPASLTTHCAVQRFRVSPLTGLLVQHDYTADVIGRWARAAHVILEHGMRDGLAYPSHRRVTPRGPTGRPMRGPIVVERVVRDWRLVDA